jgi:hypothetical protein
MLPDLERMRHAEDVEFVMALPGDGRLRVGTRGASYERTTTAYSLSVLANSSAGIGLPKR